MIGIVGRLVPVKRHNFFIRLAVELLKERDDVDFVIIGDGPLENEVKGIIREKGLQGKIKMTGFIEDIIKYINGLDMLVITSQHEGIPYVLLEAMMLKKPVIATNVGGIPEVIKSGFNGMLSETEDLLGMKNNIIELLDHPDQMASIGENGYKTVLDNFSAISMSRQTMDLYQSLLTSRG
jgi:glycosyltransferase involved in cell wall biosynthesis